MSRIRILGALVHLGELFWGLNRCIDGAVAAQPRLLRARRWVPVAHRRWQGARRLLPQGSTLPEAVWHVRHRGILVLLWAHAIAVPVYALVRGYPLAHVFTEGAVLPLAAGVASSEVLPRRARTAVASIGLLSASAVLVHLSGGLIEMHFHFFVMVAVVALYQDWIPFLTSIAYVLVHHGVLGALDPHSVFNHPAALNHPWRWGAIHALFIAGISAVCLVTWRLNESILAQQRLAEAHVDEERRVVEVLNEVGKAVAAELELKAVLQRVTDAATELSSAAFGAFFYNVTDDGDGSYTLYTLSGAPREAFERFPMPRSTAVFGPTFAGEAVIRVADVTEDPRYGKNPPYRGMPPGHLPVRSYLAVPVRSRSGEVFGGLFLGHSEPGRFNDVHERLVVGIAAHAAVAIDNARLYESEHHAREAAQAAQGHLAVLAAASQALSATLELNGLLDNLAGAIVPAVGDRCTVFLADGLGAIRPVASRAQPILSRQPHGLVPNTASLHDDADPVARVIRSGRAELFSEIPPALIDWAIGHTGRPAGVDPGMPVSAVVAPMRRRDAALGAICITTTTLSARTLGEDDVELAEELAARAAVAVENARLFAGQRSIAEALQHSLLPEHLPEVSGITTAARYLAAAPDVDVGGDWYDMLTLPDGSVLVALGDVVGKGVPAASLMGQLRNAIRAYAYDGHSPAAICTRLNGLLCETGPANAMATLIVATLHPARARLQFVRAGHLPPLVANADGSTWFCEDGGGIPIGVVPGTTYSEATTCLRPGSTLILYTDGLVEDRHLSLDVGLRQLQDAATTASGTLEDLCDLILSSNKSRTRTDDDIALLVLRADSAAPLPATGISAAIDLRDAVGGATDDLLCNTRSGEGGMIKHEPRPTRGETEKDTPWAIRDVSSGTADAG